MGVLAALVGPVVVPLALVAGIVFQVLYPGDFGYTLQTGGPALATWFALVGTIAALAPIVMFAVRAVYEERFLARELDGYADYMERVPYRFVPGLW